MYILSYAMNVGGLFSHDVEIKDTLEEALARREHIVKFNLMDVPYDEDELIRKVENDRELDICWEDKEVSDSSGYTIENNIHVLIMEI